MTINYSTTGNDVITACDSYTWIDGITYTSSNNTATYKIQNINTKVNEDEISIYLHNHFLDN